MHDLVEDTEAPPERDEQATSGEGAHPAGLHRVLFIIATMVVFGLVPYVVPQVREFRAWSPGNPLPFTGLFEFSPPVRPGITGGSGSSAAPQSDDDLLAVAPLPTPQAPRPAPPPASDASVEAAVESPAPRVPADRLTGVTREIETFDGGELDLFYERLAAVGRREEGTLARMMVYSVSTNGADRVTSAIRQQLQDLFGDGGKGWVHIAPGWTYQGHRDVEWTVGNWRTAVVNRGRVDHDRYGLGGVFVSNTGPLSSVTYGTVDEGPSNRELALWRVFYQAWPGGGDMILRVDGRDHERLSLDAPAMEDRVHEVRLSRAPHEVSINVGQGHIRLYGVTLETDGPGVVVDGLMLIGASVRALHNFDEDHIATQVRQREPDLMVFWLGGNDVISRHFTRDRFRSDYGQTIERVRAGRPDASCLVVSVLDKGHMDEGRIRTRAYVEAVVETQELVARDQGCAFFNLYEATGGRNTMARWFHSSPRLAVSDYTHLTEAGARVVGSLIARALLQGYDNYLAAGGRSTPEPTADGGAADDGG